MGSGFSRLSYLIQANEISQPGTRKDPSDMMLVLHTDLQLRNLHIMYPTPLEVYPSQAGNLCTSPLKWLWSLN